MGLLHICCNYAMHYIDFLTVDRNCTETFLKVDRNSKRWTETVNDGPKLKTMDRNFKLKTETLNDG